MYPYVNTSRHVFADLKNLAFVSYLTFLFYYTTMPEIELKSIPFLSKCNPLDCIYRNNYNLCFISSSLHLGSTFMYVECTSIQRIYTFIHL